MTVKKTPQRGEQAAMRHGREQLTQLEEVRRRNLLDLVGTTRFPTLKSLSDALGYKDQSRISHLKNGVKHISERLARGIEEQLRLDPGQLDREGGARAAAAVGTVDRRRAAQMYLTREATARELAGTYGVEEAQIYRWVAELKQEDATPAPASTNRGGGKGGKGSAELEAEVRRLKDKLAAIILEREGLT